MAAAFSGLPIFNKFRGPAYLAGQDTTREKEKSFASSETFRKEFRKDHQSLAFNLQVAAAKQAKA
jgi:hypothetical protein